MCVCVCERERERERECVCVCVCVQRNTHNWHLFLAPTNIDLRMFWCAHLCFIYAPSYLHNITILLFELSNNRSISKVIYAFFTYRYNILLPTFFQFEKLHMTLEHWIRDGKWKGIGGWGEKQNGAYGLTSTKYGLRCISENVCTHCKKSVMRLQYRDFGTLFFFP